MLNKTFLKTAILLLSLGALNIGCSSNEDAAAESTAESLVISGTLGSASSSKLTKVQQNLGAMAVTASELEIYGLAFSDPPEVQTVELGSDGSFSLSFSSAASGAQISLIFRYKAGTDKAGNEVGVVKFVDTSDTDIDGNSSSSSSVSLSGAVSLGDLSIDENGDVSVPVAQIATAITATTIDSATAFDFSGNWQFAAFDGTVPSGYAPPCAIGDGNCNGPELGMPIHLKRIAGKKYTPGSVCAAAAANDTFDPNGTCSGTVGTKDKYMIQVWKSATAATSCGDKLGVNYSVAQAYAQVDFSNSGITQGSFAWSDSNLTEGWKLAAATATNDVHRCSTVVWAHDSDSTKNVKAYKCIDGDGDYEIGFEGGCQDSAGNPIQVNDWSTITPDSCDDSPVTGFTGISENICTYTNQDPDGSGSLAATNFTCKFSGGQFDAGGTTPGSSFDWATAKIIDQGDNCSDITTGVSDEQDIASLKCYANYYYDNYQSENENLCVRELKTNWGAIDPDDFVLKSNGPEKARNLFVLSLFQYDTASSGFFEDNDVYYRGIQTGTQSYTNCKVKDEFKMSLKKRSTSVMVAEFVTKVTLLDTGKDACVADAESSDGQLGIGASKTIMLLNKQ